MNDFITLRGICTNKKSYVSKDGTEKYVNYFDIGGDDLIDIVTDNDKCTIGQPWQIIISSSRFGLKCKCVCPIAE